MEAKARTCLKCNRVFLSLGSHNRICNRCHRLAEESPPVPAKIIQRQRGGKRWNDEPHVTAKDLPQ